MATGLPEGWATIRVGDYFDSWGGMTPSTSNAAYWGGTVPWVSSKDIKAWRVAGGEEFITRKALQETRLRLCPVGSVLIVVRSGILAHTLPIAVVDSPVSINQDLKAFYSPDSNLNEWLALAMRALAPEILTNNRKDGTTVQSVRYEELCDLIIPVPPSAEQRRITKRLAELRQKVRYTREHLSRVPTILKRFRQAVLAAACSGRLTEGLRDEQVLGSASVLLEHILNERAHRWKEQQEASGKRSPLNYPKPFEPSIVDLPDLPERWVWATLDQLIADGPQNGLYKPQTDYGQGVPIIRIEDFQDNFVRKRDALSKLRVTDEEARLYGVAPSDFVINRVNSPSHIGKCLVVPRELCPAVFESNMMRMRFSSMVQPMWIAACLRSTDGKMRLTQNAKWAVNQVSINQTDVRSTAVPLPPAEEQWQIIARIDGLFALADTIEGRVAAASLRSDKLTQSILAKAFRGELVPTEAELARREGREYEPASVLLEKIRAERADQQSSASRRRNVRKASAHV